MLKQILLETPNEGQHFEEAHVFKICQKVILIITLLKCQDGD